MMDKKTQKIGVICSIVQIILSIICLIYSAINQENIKCGYYFYALEFYR